MEFQAESVFLSKILDYLGYSHCIVRLRQRCYNEVSCVLNGREEGEMIQTGSKSEGLTSYMENDFDIMVVAPEIICASNPNRYRDICEEVNVFGVERAETSGYARLKLHSTLHNFDLALIYLNGCAYLSNYQWKHLLDDIQDPDIQVNLIHGPALQCGLRIDDVSLFDCDVVTGIRCDSPDMLHTWLNGERFHDWPSAEVIETIASIEAHAVPVGFKGSQYESIEWRICFTKAEIKLVQNLNDCQKKLLVLLKWIAKGELKPISKEISSYVMKNVVLWLAELYPAEIFVENNLIMLLKGALMFIKLSLINNNLPSYMIVERNLLANRVSVRRRSRLCMKIDLLQHEGPRLILRCDKIKSACIIMNISPGTLCMYSQNRHVVEIFVLAVLGGIPLPNELLIRLFEILLSEDFGRRIYDMNEHELKELVYHRFNALTS